MLKSHNMTEEGGIQLLLFFPKLHLCSQPNRFPLCLTFFIFHLGTLIAIFSWERFLNPFLERQWSSLLLMTLSHSYNPALKWTKWSDLAWHDCNPMSQPACVYVWPSWPLIPDEILPFDNWHGSFSPAQKWALQTGHAAGPLTDPAGAVPGSFLCQMENEISAIPGLGKLSIREGLVVFLPFPKFIFSLNSCIRALVIQH